MSVAILGLKNSIEGLQKNSKFIEYNIKLSDENLYLQELTAKLDGENITIETNFKASKETTPKVLDNIKTRYGFKENLLVTHTKQYYGSINGKTVQIWLDESYELPEVNLIVGGKLPAIESLNVAGEIIEQFDEEILV